MNVPYQEKAKRIAEDLREHIISGVYRQGDRLPTRTELLAAYQVSSNTLQRAIDWLLAEGFLVSEGRRGTFVHPQPPHLANYALLFPNRFVDGEPRNRFHHALYHEALRLPGGRRMRICDGFSGRAGFLDYDSLLDDVRQHRLAGLIFETSPYALDGTPLVADDGLPRTAIMSRCGYPHIPAVYPDTDQLAMRAAERFEAEGRRNVAVLVNATWDASHVNALRGEFCRRGLIQNETSLMGVSVEQPAWACEVTKLLFGAPRTERPDALLVADDHFLEPATRALMDMGVRAPEDVLIISHTNYPWPAPSHLPVVRVGFSVPDMLNACIYNIELLRDGGKPEPLTLLPPLFEDEFPVKSMPSECGQAETVCAR